MKTKKILARIAQKILDERTRYPTDKNARDALVAVMNEVSTIAAELDIQLLDELEPGSHDRDALFIAKARAVREQAQG
jgi:hypothetical protein